MINDFTFDVKNIKQIKNLNHDIKNNRLANLEIYNKNGFPSKKDEEWKYSDLNKIVKENFKKIKLVKKNKHKGKIELLEDFEHNFIILNDGSFVEANFEHEDKDKIKISEININEPLKKLKNSLVCLNNALFDRGFNLTVRENYKLKKSIVIYDYFSDELNDNIVNIRNNIVIEKNAEAHIINYSINNSKNKFFSNVYESISLDKNSVLKNIYVQDKKSLGYFYKFLEGKMSNDSHFSGFVFSSGLKFNKIDAEFALNGENSFCQFRSALFLNEDRHQEIKTKINHLVPNCRSFQKIKGVIDSNAKGVYQGKIYVQDIAQKTDAYQLSKALLLSDNSEFDSKPELEIYADDVKCSHGSSSGSVDENSIHYLMTRGLKKEKALSLLVNGFLNEIVEEIKSNSVRKFVNSKLERQINGY